VDTVPQSKIYFSPNWASGPKPHPCRAESAPSGPGVTPRRQDGMGADHAEMKCRHPGRTLDPSINRQPRS
jgi:hypothetical protein